MYHLALTHTPEVKASYTSSLRPHTLVPLYVWAERMYLLALTHTPEVKASYTSSLRPHPLVPLYVWAERMYLLALTHTPEHLDCLWSYGAFLQVCLLFKSLNRA
jgi:predicted MPP superfamily phosphohydrolase